MEAGDALEFESRKGAFPGRNPGEKGKRNEFSEKNLLPNGEKGDIIPLLMKVCRQREAQAPLFLIDYLTYA